jgi:hypothetical protein
MANKFNLEQTTVHRGGKTANGWDEESTQCTAEIMEDGGGLGIEFSIRSKGGGTTCVFVSVSIEDLAVILKELAIQKPENAELFADYAKIAIQKITSMVQTLTEPKVLEYLEKVQGFAYDRYWDRLDRDGEAKVENDEYFAAKEVVDIVKALGKFGQQ